ncbi:MAG: IclR family transcriptional regulator [Actinomycetota bacterium]|jgi:DNA-binding IclR family transcriptional regulator|nr:IclR family transcriptional regulator [Actinomycetota bacterium]MDA8359077.1 IclR family transcriptional regulator [Actinomycetota bacterium]
MTTASPRGTSSDGRALTLVQRNEREETAPLVQSLVHGLQILDLFSDTRPVIGIGEMARALGVHRSTTSRLAATLAAYGYLERTGEPGHYSLAERLFRLGQLATPEADLRVVAAKELGELVERVGETAHAGVLYGREVTSILVIDGWRPLRLHGQVGKRSPAHCSSLGKALLAWLSPSRLAEIYAGGRLDTCTPYSIRTLAALRAELAATKARGYALDDQELEIGLRCVGAPILDDGGAPLASMSVSGPLSRMQGDLLGQLQEEIPAVAARISERLATARRALAPATR